MTERKLFRGHIGELVAALILGILEILALSVYYRDSIGFWFRSFVPVLILLGLWILSAALIFLFFRLTQALLKPERILKKDSEGEGRFTDRHPFLLAAVVLTVFYLPWIIIFYPGSAIYDMMYQTVQADGFMAINAHHPIFATYVIGFFSKIGLAISGSLNLGIFFYILFQSGVCIVSFAYMMSFLKKAGIGRGFWYAVLFWFAILPLWGGAMQNGTKDTLFTGLFVLFAVQSAKLLLAGSRGDQTPLFSKFRPLTWVGYGLLILLLCLYRNGILVILAPTMAVFFFSLRKGAGRKALLVTAIAALVLAAAFGTLTKRAYNTKTETGEILTIPFQQTARFVRDHPEEASEEEQEIIEKTFVLKDYKKLGDLYYPMSSDPVKARYHWWAADNEKEILSDYFAVWASMLKKEPLTYAEALLAQTYGYYSITPVIKDQKGGAGTTVQFYPDRIAVQYVVDQSDGELSQDLVPESPKALAGAQKVLQDWYVFWQKAPVLGLFFKCGFYFYILLALTFFYCKRKNRLSVLVIPSFLLILMAIASPVNEHIRYILPAIAALPVFPVAAAAEERIKTIGGEHEREST